METKQDYKKYQRAKKQVAEIKGFYSHLLSYVFVMSILIFVNLKYSPEHLWFIYSMFGWGVGVFFHALKVFNWFPFMGKNWEEKKIQEFMEQEKNKQNKFE